jgi:putative ABC transport system substrate-binding protein
LPSARKVALMGSLTQPAADGGVAKAMEAAAQTLKLDLQIVRISGANEFETAVVKIAERNVDAIIVSTAPLIIANYDRIAALAARQRIPTLGNVNFADGGGLVGYGANVLNNYRRTAYFIDRIFKGTRPADLPIEQPTAIELVINLKIAKALGIRIPDTVMVRVDRVIE